MSVFDSSANGARISMSVSSFVPVSTTVWKASKNAGRQSGYPEKSSV